MNVPGAFHPSSRSQRIVVIRSVGTNERMNSVDGQPGNITPLPTPSGHEGIINKYAHDLYATMMS